MKTLAPPPSDRETAPAHVSSAALLAPDVVEAFFALARPAAKLFASLLREELGLPPLSVVASQAYYSKQNPPPKKSWRAARETCNREGIPVVRVGRDVLIPVEAWQEYLARRTTRRGPVEIRSGDEAALAKMGVHLRGLPGGRR